MNIIGKKNLYFLISSLVIVPGLISLILFGLRFSIDFTGGSLLELKIVSPKTRVGQEELQKVIEEENVTVGSIQSTDQDTYLFRLKEINKDKNQTLKKKISDKFGTQVTEVRFETVGPVIGRELAQKSSLAIVVASIAVVLYISWAFSKVRKPASPWRFGICAIIALIHDVLVVVGVFSLLGHFAKVEVDTLFVTALLTVIGFSVHDTIVVFDRIRENLSKMPGESFATVVNESILQTLVRSLGTSLTVVFTLFALLLFSTGSLRWFIVALLVGIVSGTYSSIFNAAPLLVLWHEWRNKKKKV